MPRLANALIWLWACVVAVSYAGNLLDLGVPVPRWPAQYATALGLVPLLLIASLSMRIYGLRGRFGRALLFAALGAIVWAGSDLLYTLRSDCAGCTPPPFPSISDVGFLTGPLLWVVTLVLLWRAVGLHARELVGYAWMPAVTLAAVAVLALPTFVEPLGVPLGLDLFRLSDRGAGEVALTLTYLVYDALMVPAAVVLWRRSFGFHAYRQAARALVVMFVADITYNARIAADTYVATLDVSDAFYAGTTLFLMLSISSFEASGRRELAARDRALRELLETHARGTAEARP